MNEQTTDTDILTWLQGRCMKINIVTDTGEDAVVWSAEDGTSIADMVLGYCKENNIDVLQEINSACVETPSKVELTKLDSYSKDEAEKLISAAWTEGVEYRGLNIYKVLYTTDAIWQESITRHIPDDHQECYLGYIADEDRFLVGFDTWPFEGDGYCEEADEGSYSVVSFKLHPSGFLTNIEPVPEMEPMFYKNNRRVLRERHPTLYDIRLD